MSHPIFKVGNQIFVRTVTHYLVGLVTYVDKKDVVLENASWVADTGRFHDALKTGKFNEVEPFCEPVSFSRGAYVDATIWPHELPQAQK